MSPKWRIGIVLAALMFAATTLAYALKPTRKLADLQPREKLETLLPMQFGDWRAMPSNNMVLADPQMREKLERIYTETLSRHYVDSHGRQIMLSIAYGEDQRDSMALHYPEVCYPSQGFQTISNEIGHVTVSFGSIPVRRLVMVSGLRVESITYWATVGEYTNLGGIHQKLSELRYGLNGIIPDGLLFRVSSIGRETEQAFRDQDKFTSDLLGAISQSARKRIAGL